MIDFSLPPEVEEIRLRTPRGSPAVRNVFTRTGIWTNVQRFSWVEFVRSEGEPLRARLTWISPAKGVYLFTNPHGNAAVSISPEALAEQMRRGEAKLLGIAKALERLLPPCPILSIVAVRLSRNRVRCSL